MAVTRAQKLRLGIFVATGLVALVGGLIVLAGMRLGEVRDTYRVRYADGDVSLSGLEVGSPVKYSGIRVGRVDVIRIDPQDVGVVLVEISLTGGTPVAEDTQASLGSMGITGLKYIELTRGSRAARVRKPGEEIPAGKSALDDLSNQAGEIAAKVSEALDRVNAFVSPDMKDRLASVLDRTDKLLATAEATIAENREGVRALTASLAITADRVGALLDEAGPNLTRTLDEGARTARTLRDASGKLDGLLGDARKATQSLDKVLDVGGQTLAQTRESLVQGLVYFRDSASNLKAFSRKVKDDPSLLLLSEGGEE
ncbi:MAG: MCE family protein [Myxococcales bacterium]|nr:MCE family protein [Myxococcales bacterium]